MRWIGVNGLSKELKNDPQAGAVNVSAEDEGMKKVEGQRPGIWNCGNAVNFVWPKDFDGCKNSFVLVSKHNG